MAPARPAAVRAFRTVPEMPPVIELVGTRGTSPAKVVAPSGTLATRILPVTKPVAIASIRTPFERPVEVAGDVKLPSAALVVLPQRVPDPPLSDRKFTVAPPIPAPVT